MTYFRLLSSFIFPACVGATTIVGSSPSQADPAHAYVLSENVQDLSWTSSLAYTNVNIMADLGVVSCCAGSWSLTGTAYLTNRVGPAATTANVLDSTPITLSGSSNTSQNFGPYSVPLFQNLTLAPGSYNVVLTADSDPQGLGVVTLLEENFLDPTFTVTTGAGVSGVVDRYATDQAGSPNLSFAPSSTFIDQPFANLQIFAVGDPTPEPSTILLFATGATLLVVVKKRTRKRSGFRGL